MSKILALVDCNNFFASCERVFRPDLEHKPVAVLSNNDGCVIARSNEVKRLGVRMGQPYFEIKKLVEENNINIFSTNFALYGDISNRVMRSLARFTPSIEKYSIDEAFLDFTDIQVESFDKYARQIKTKVKKWTGIPVSIGIARSKTLCKIGNELVKKYLNVGGVIDLTSIDNNKLDEYLGLIPVGDVWGVGRQSNKFLKAYNIKTAKDLKYADKRLIKKKMGVLGERIILELNGTSCINIEKGKAKKKGISCTRTFAKAVYKEDELAENVSVYTDRATEKLRSQNSVANLVTVFVRTNPHKTYQKYYSNSYTVGLSSPSCSTPVLAKAAKLALSKIFKSGHAYKKAGVILSAIHPDNHVQYDMLNEHKEEDLKRDKKLMGTIDKINTSWGRHTIRLANTGDKRGWFMNQMNKSPRYTTQWSELLKVA